MTADAVGGVWTYALDLAAGLAPLGVDVLLAVMGDAPTNDQRADAGRLGNVRLAVGAFKLEWQDDPWDDVRAAGDWLLDLERQWRPDVVHLNGYAHGALPWSAPVLVAAHSCVLSWWQAVKGESAPATWATYRRAVTAGLPAADLVVAPTGAMLNCTAEHYGPLSRARVIPNGRDPAPYAAAAARRAKEPLVLAAGRLWDEAKNVATLARAAGGLPWPVCLAGDDRHPTNGTTAAFENVRLLGRLPPSELADWLARASVYALPARYEPFGLSALEAAYAGCALVLGDVPSLREVWGDAAVYVHPDDADGLRDAIASLAADPRRLAEMATRARERAARYTPERMAGEYREAYRELIVAGSRDSAPAPVPRRPERGEGSPRTHGREEILRSTSG